MLTVTSAQLDLWLAGFIWPFVRILAMVATDPFFGNRSVPRRVKVGLSVMLTVILTPVLGEMPHVSPGSAAGILIMVQQIMIGVSMGLAMRIVFASFEMAGHLAGLQMGLGFATFFDPQRGTQVQAVSTFTGLLALLLFLSMNGHLVVIRALAESFYVLPVSSRILSVTGWKTLVEWGGEIFKAGLLISLPIVAVLLVANLAMGIMSRAAPQVNLFAVGFPITLGIGFFMLYLSLPYFTPLFDRIFNDGISTTLQILRQANPAHP